MRSILLILTIVAGYALLRGWPENWHPIMRICLSVSALVVALGLWGRSTKPTSTLANSDRKPRFLDYATVVIAVLIVECFFLIFLAIAPTKSQEFAIALDDALHPEDYSDAGAGAPEGPGSSLGPGGDGGLITSNWLFSGPGPRKLNKNAKVRPSNRPEVYLFPKSKKDAQVLLGHERFLRNFTLATYRDGSWYPHTIVPRTLRAETDTIVRPPKTPGTKVRYDISHQANISAQTLAVTVPNFTAIKQPTLRETSPDTFRLPPNTAQGKNYRYEVSSIPFDFNQVTQVKPGATPSPEYLTLPPDPTLRQKIERLASTYGPVTRDSILALRQDIRARCQYSLDINMPAELDPLDGFLFETNIGYCTHFATATVMLARAMGIPSRIAFGWSGGRYFAAPNLFVFRAREAHAWAELYLADYGWVIFETTPAIREEGSPSIAEAEETSPYLADLKGADTDDLKKHLGNLLRVTLWIGGAASFALILALLLRRPYFESSEAVNAFGVLPATPNYLSAFRRACLAHGHPMPPGRTLRAHLAKIPAPNFTATLLQYHYAVHYGDQPRDKPTEKKLLSQLRNWEKQTR